MEMDPRLKAILNKRRPYKRPSKNADDAQAAAGPSSTADTTAAAISDNTGAKSKPKKTVDNRKKRQQEFEALKARLQEKLHNAAVEAAAEQKEQEEREAVASLEGAANGEAKMPAKSTNKIENSKKKSKSKRRTKKTNDENKMKNENNDKNKNLKHENKTKGEEKNENGAHHEGSKDNPDLLQPFDPATALERMRIIDATSKDPVEAAMKNKIVHRHPLNPPTYTSALKYVDSDTGKLIPEKMAELKTQDRCRIYADFLVPRLKELHPTSYDFIMDKMYQMPNDMVVQMIYSDYLLGEFAAACAHQLQKISKPTKRRRQSP